MNDVEQPFSLRLAESGDQPAIESIYPLAFPDEDLVPLLRDLWREPETILSLVAVSDGALVGHILFTRCNLATGATPMALLAPIAVRPDRQSQGIGSALIREGFQRLEEEGVVGVCVLGDPAYYSRFGFEATADIAPPYSPQDPPEQWIGAWRAVALNESLDGLRGRLRLPAAWNHEELWLP